MKLTDRADIPPHVIARTAGDDVVILDLQSGSYFGLDPVGARIWQLLEQGKSLDEACDALVAEFEVTRDTVERDALALAAELITRKLIAPR